MPIRLFAFGEKRLLLRQDELSEPEILKLETGSGLGSSEPSLTSRVVRGAVWVLVGKGASRLLGFVRTVILARLLAPGDFGLFGIVMLAQATLDTFTQTGFGAALIQRKADIKGYLDTAWTVQVIRRLVLAMGVFAGAPLVGWFFVEPRAVPLLRLMSISIALSGFVNIGIIYFRKELQFRRQVAYDVLSYAVGLVVGVFLAFRLRNVWALVWAELAVSASNCVLSYLLHPYRPRLHFEGAQAAELFRFGRWMLASSIVIFLATRGDSAFLGKMLGVAALGIYQVAYHIANAPATEITDVTNAVMMPTYAKLQGDKGRLGRAFLQVFEVVFTLASPLTVFIVLAAPEMVLGIFGSKWQAAIVPIEILAVSGFLVAIAATAGPVFLGTGHPHMDFWMNLCRVGTIAVCIYPLTMLFGVAGTCFSIVLGLAATLPIWASVRGICGLSFFAIIRSMTQGLVLAGLVIIAFLVVRLIGGGFGHLGTLAFQGAAAASVCGVAVLISGKWLNWGVSVFAARAWRSIRTS